MKLIMELKFYITNQLMQIKMLVMACKLWYLEMTRYLLLPSFFPLHMSRNFDCMMEQWMWDIVESALCWFPLEDVEFYAYSERG